MDISIVVLGIVFAPTLGLVGIWVGTLLKRIRRQDKYISKLRIHVVTTCLEKSDSIEELTRLVLGEADIE